MNKKKNLKFGVSVQFLKLLQYPGFTIPFSVWGFFFLLCETWLAICWSTLPNLWDSYILKIWSYTFCYLFRNFNFCYHLESWEPLSGVLLFFDFCVSLAILELGWLCGLGWPQAHRYLPAYLCLDLKVYTTTTRLCSFFFF